MADEFELYEGADGKQRWRLTSSDSEVVSSGDVSMSRRMFAGMSASEHRSTPSALQSAWLRITRRARTTNRKPGSPPE